MTWAVVIGAVIVMVLITRAIANPARSGGSEYAPSNLGACALIALAVIGGAVLIYASRGH